jgi:hypothetical protein
MLSMLLDGLFYVLGVPNLYATCLGNRGNMDGGNLRRGEG